MGYDNYISRGWEIEKICKWILADIETGHIKAQWQLDTISWGVNHNRLLWKQETKIQ